MNIDQAIQALSLEGNNYIKSTLLLTVSFFLISAPAPDANVIADITSNLIVSVETHASELKYPLS
ncbi:MAG: hypothetical protein WBN06_04870 [Lysobacterales bacterium]|jgi:hypothetical protein